MQRQRYGAGGVHLGEQGGGAAHAHKVLRLFKEEVRLRGVTKALFNAMALYNFVHYTSEVLALVALYAVRFVDVNPLSSRSFALKYKTSSISSLH